MNRRRVLVTLATALSAPAVLRRRYQVSAQSSAVYSARAVTLVRESAVIDMLCQFSFPQPRPGGGTPIAMEWLRNPSSFMHSDYVKFQESGMKVLALGQSRPTLEGQMFYCAQWNGFIASHPDWFIRIDDPRDLERAASSARVGIMITAQDANYFRSLTDVDLLHSLGQRVAQLTYNTENRLGSGFLADTDGGLTAFGQGILERMQGVGMAVDASHCGDKTTLDALAAAKKPIVFTHATCRSLVPGHLRCKTDEMIRKLAAGGGVMGMPFVPWIIRSAPPVTIEHVVDHVEHIARLVGVEHVGIGSDIDIDGYGAVQPLPGTPTPTRPPNFERMGRSGFPQEERGIQGLDHPLRVFDFTEALIRRGFSDADIRLVLGANWVRVLTAFWN